MYWLSLHASQPHSATSICKAGQNIAIQTNICTCLTRLWVALRDIAPHPKQAKPRMHLQYTQSPRSRLLVLDQWARPRTRAWVNVRGYEDERSELESLATQKTMHQRYRIPVPPGTLIRASSRPFVAGLKVVLVVWMRADVYCRVSVPVCVCTGKKHQIPYKAA